MRFFLKIFLSFLVTVLLASVVLFWSGHYLRAKLDEHVRQNQHELLQERLELITILETQGVDAVRQKLALSPFKNSLLVFDAQNQDLSGRLLPDELLENILGEPYTVVSSAETPASSMEKKSHSLGEHAPKVEGPTSHHPLLVQDPENQSYTLAFMPMPPRWWLVVREYPLLPLGVIVVSSLVVFLQASHLSKPIRRLRKMTMALARGDLTARAIVKRGRFPDELHDLEKDFNFMAGQLEELFHAQNRLLRDVSHELRSPLARIRVALGLMEQAHTDADGNLDRMVLELERLDELIGQIITVSSPSVPGKVRRDILVDLGEMVHNVVADGRFETARQEQALVLDQVDTALLWADASSLHSAMDNVLRNALQHSGQKGLVHAALICQDHQARFVVSDQGPGVPEEDLHRIFLPFYRVESSRMKCYGGFGLGLAIAARVAKEHGGSIAARNRSEGGLEVTITLPLESNTAVDNEDILL
ncbi:MAG: ATP-binding protein [Magnetococcus sp. THC-1_WYH]